MTHRYHPDEQQAAHTGKNANDVNKAGHEKPTQKNEAQRTPESRHDREAQVGGNNESKTRRGTPQGDGAGAQRKR